MSYVKYYGFHSDIEIETPEDADTTKYFYILETHAVTLYKENIETEKGTEVDEERIKREQREARKAELNEISNRAYKLRTDFVKEISNTKARKNMETIIEFTLYAMVEKYGTLGYVELAELLNVEIDDKEDDEIGIEWKDIASHIWKQPELNLLLVAYDIVDSSSKKYSDWNGKYRRDEDLDYVYDFLQKLGYKMSEEEKALQKGTHELFKAGDE